MPCFRNKTTFHLYAQLSYTKISYLSKNTHLRKDAAFSHFCLKESSENMIFSWNEKIQKLVKIWSFLSFSQIFVRRKFLFSCSVWWSLKTTPNGHTTSNPCQFDVGIILIRERQNFDKFLRHFRVLFQCNFADQKIHVASKYSFHVVSMVE